MYRSYWILYILNQIKLDLVEDLMGGSPTGNYAAHLLLSYLCSVLDHFL